MPQHDVRTITSAPLRHLLYVPAARPPNAERLPVLCFLHGYDEAAPMDLRRALTLHGPLRAESLPHVADRFLVVAPQLPAAGDLWHLHEAAVRDVVTAARDAHGGDPARTYLTGFSFGGNGVFDLALAQPDLWAALWPVDPTRPPTQDPARPVWLSVGEIARSRRDRFVRALALRDAATEATSDRLFLDEGEDHVGSATRAYQDARIYAWLLARRHPTAR